MTEGSRPQLSRSRKLVFGLVFVALTLLLVEVAGRGYYRFKTGSWAVPDSFSPPDAGLFRPHPNLGSALARQYHFISGGEEVVTNSLGFRNPEVEIPKPAGRVRVLCLGGSAVFDTRVKDNESTWPAQLGKRLRAEKPETDFEVINGGCSGWTTAESLINLQLRGLEVEPDLVIVYHTWNDLKPAQAPGFLSDYSHWRQVSCPEKPGIVRRSLRNSLMFLKLERMMRRARGKTARDRALAGSDRSAKLPVAAESVFRRNLQCIAGVCEKFGVELALSTYATRYSQFEDGASGFDNSWAPNFSAEELQRAFRRYADIVRETASRESTYLIDAQKKLPIGSEVFADFVHFDDPGAVIMAGLVYEELESQGVWDGLLSARPGAARTGE